MKLLRKLADSGEWRPRTRFTIRGAHFTLSDNPADDQSLVNKSIKKIELENCTKWTLSLIGKLCPNTKFVVTSRGTIDYHNIMTSSRCNAHLAYHQRGDEYGANSPQVSDGDHDHSGGKLDNQKIKDNLVRDREAIERSYWRHDSALFPETRTVFGNPRLFWAVPNLSEIRKLTKGGAEDLVINALSSLFSYIIIF